MTTVKNIYDYINKIAPFEQMEEWDNSGFLVGDFRKEVKRAVLSLDASKSAAEYAKGVGADILITHHPLIFTPVKSVEKGSALYELISGGVAVISMHTSFDKADGGINDNLTSLFTLKNTYRLDNGYVTVGELGEDMSIDDFVIFVGEVLECKGLRYTDTDKIIKRVAVGGGACGEFWQEASRCADCFVTGEVKYHEMLEASESGFAVINAGHFETENLPFLMIKNKLAEIFTDVEFLIAPVENPVKEI